MRTQHTVEILVRLKVRMVRNTFRSRSLRFRSMATLVLSIGAGVFGFVSVLTDGFASQTKWSHSLVSTFTLVFVGWIFMPLAFGGLDDSIDPSRLALFALSKRERTWGVLAASFVGFLPLTTFVILVASVIAHARGVMGLFVGLAASLHFLICILSSRLVGALLSRASESRKGRDISVVVASLGAVSLWALTQSLTVVSSSHFHRILGTLELLPSGIAAKAIVEARLGHVYGALIRLGFASVITVGLFVSWSKVFGASGAFNGRPSGTRKSSVSSLQREHVQRWRIRSFLVRKLIGSRAIPIWMTLAAKEFRYLYRSPQRRASLLIGMVLGGPFLLTQFAGRTLSQEAVYTAGVAFAFSLGLVNNVLGADAPSLWLEITAGVRLRTILMSRSFAAFPFVVLPIASAATATAAIVGFSRHYVATMLLSLLCAGIPLGVGCIVSVLSPVAQSDTDDPFSNRRSSNGDGCFTGFTAGLSMMASAAGFAPVVTMRLLFGSSWIALGLLFVGALLYAALFWTVCARWAGHRAESRMSELLGILTERNSTV
jgi:ABC-2 type transport system permease protein